MEIPAFVDCKIISDNFTYNLEVKDSVLLQLIILPSTKKDIRINGIFNVLEKGNLNVTIVDFNSYSTYVDIKGDLYEESNTIYHVGVNGYSNSNKIYDIKLNVIGKKTNSLVKMNGVISDQADIRFLGTTKINKGSIKSVARQEGRIINLSNNGKGQVNPILQIDENDIMASHGAALGQIDKNILFYLMSRGIKLEDAIKLITVSYLKPFIKEIYDENIQSQLLKYISEKEGI